MKSVKESETTVPKHLLLLLALFAGVLLLIGASLRNQQTWFDLWTPETEVNIKGVSAGSIDGTATATIPNDPFLGGLLNPGFDEESCLSRYKSILYRKASPHILSSYLISKLRKYEKLHRKCAPNTPLFLKSLEQLKSNHSNDQLKCNYVLCSPIAGMGNRMLALVSTFLYALLTNRVMLIERTSDISDLLCEPFIGSTWYIPDDFPKSYLEGYDLNSQKSYGYMIAHGLISEDPYSNSSALPSFVYAHLQYNYLEQDFHKRFFCEDDQKVINKINWVLLKSDAYFVPGLFMIPKYEEEFERMFPLKETVFHHLGRYLLHPSNPVWEMVMRYNNSYLARPKERIGIQARIYNWPPISVDEMYKKIVECTQQELILPKINHENSEGSALVLNKTKTHAVLVASLYGEFAKRLKDMYDTHSTSTGDIITVYQPTHEGEQRFGQLLHNQKALAEIWLLSFSDVLVTTARSTFGYVAYSLAGIKPWFLLQKDPYPPCRRGLTIDLCFHLPPDINCKTRSKTDMANLVRHVRRCEDHEGIKLFD